MLEKNLLLLNKRLKQLFEFETIIREICDQGTVRNQFKLFSEFKSLRWSIGNLYLGRRNVSTIIDET